MKTVLFVFGLFILAIIAGVAIARPVYDLKGDVMTIFVTDHSQYIVDGKRNLCFYETTIEHGVSVLPIPCSSFPTLN